ncbi:MAG: hypothetical protein OXG86_06035 [Chloroflexi bacterium]|nr:hypothetical protein [Chloroflexota bacterium]
MVTAKIPPARPDSMAFQFGEPAWEDQPPPKHTSMFAGEHIGRIASWSEAWAQSASDASGEFDTAIALFDFSQHMFGTVTVIPEPHPRDSRALAIEAQAQVLRHYQHEELADRVEELERLRSEEQEDGSSDDPLKLASLVQATLFFITNPELPAPVTTLTSDGFLYCRWPLETPGNLTLVFRDDGEITYVPGRLFPGGTACQPEVLRAVSEVLPRIATR